MVSMRVNSVERELLFALKAAGCVRVAYGCESGSQRTLNNMSKKTSVEENIQAIQMTKKAGMSCQVNIIIGLPGETRADFLETVKLLRKANPDFINRYKLIPIPSTPYFEQLLARGVIRKPENWDDLMNRYVFSDFTFAAMNPRDFRNLKDKMDREITLPINYMLRFRLNIRRNPFFALEQLIVMFLHCFILYLPIPLRERVKKVAKKLKIIGFLTV